MSFPGTQADSTFKIMIASDIHLGVHEKNGVRGEDSFVTFEEILKISKEREVDFILLGGDLFHENIPSNRCLHKCMSLLRKYTMGDRPITVSFDSNQEDNFGHCDHKIVNYLDPNINVAIPVYSIHGNHDDPSGFGRISALDLLAAPGLINYFGKWTDLNNITMKPLLMSKGDSQLAIYGISNIRDERLSRLFSSKSVIFEETENSPERFNILVLHQNRPENRGNKNYIPEEVIPDFFDMVLWGHEHECRIDPEENVRKGFVVVQPGSSVVTSLCEGEAVLKHVCILKVQGTSYEMEKIRLQTVRPFVFHAANLDEWAMKLPNQKKNEAVQEYVSKFIKKIMLPKAREQLTGHPHQPILPLVRLRLQYSDVFQLFNEKRFSQSLSAIIANIDDAVILRKDTSIRSKRKTNFDFSDYDVGDCKEVMSIEDYKVEDMAEKMFLDDGAKNSLSVLLSRTLTVGVKHYVEKQDKDALKDLVKERKRQIENKLRETEFDENNAKESILALKENESDRLQEIESEAHEFLSRLDRSTASTVVAGSGRNPRFGGDSDSDDDFGPIAMKLPMKAVENKPARGRGSRGARAGRAPRAARGRAALSSSYTHTSMDISQYVTRPRSDDMNSSGIRAKKAKIDFLSESEDS